MHIYLPLPAYQRQWAKFGFTEDDWAGKGSDRLVDRFIPWGTREQILSRMNEHIDAGANAITMTALNPDPANKEMPWDLVEAFGQN